MSTDTTTIIIDGHDVTNLVDIIDGKIVCTHCSKVVEDQNDVTYYNGDYYGENVGHDQCMTEIYLSE